VKNKTLNVVHVVRAIQTGGLETLVLEMCLQMQRLQGVDVHVCALQPGDELEHWERYLGIPKTLIAPSADNSRLASISALVRLFRRKRPDVVHLHNFLSHLNGGLAARLVGVPAVVTTKHGAGKPRVYGSRRVAGWCWRLSHVVVAVSADVQQGFQAFYDFPPGRTRLILNGIDTNRFRPVEGDREELRRRVVGLSGSPMLGTVCRLVSDKGIRTLLTAFATIVAQAPRATLVIVGNGEDRAGLEQETARLGLRDRVAFLGNRGDVDAIYPLLDIYVQPSYTEGISLTMLEACSCALPVVATAVGGNPEIVLEGQTGNLVPPRDAPALASAILAQWNAPEVARAMGQSARRRVAECFSIERTVRDYVELYHDIQTARAPESQRG
jgi:glycosyltransferase involved in cell wall biosynthesis